MDIYVFDTAFDMVGVVDAYTSLIWTTRYYAPGDFELYLPATDAMISLLQEDYYLCRADDIDGDTYKNVMVIETVNPKTDVEDGNSLTVTGRCLKSILSRRIIWNQTSINGKLELGIRKILTENVIAPAVSERAISNFTLGESKGFTDRIEIQATGDEIAAFLQEVCTPCGMGWDVWVKGHAFVFELYKGVDRSYNQTANPYVVFSPEYDNLVRSDYSYSKVKYKNTALVAGEGEGIDRRREVVGDYSGLQRYEVYVDARDISSNEGEIADEQYKAMLSEKGTEKLSELGAMESFEGEIEVSSNYILGEDYFLGDVVEVINEYGIDSSPRIVEIIDADDDTGRSIIPTFSTWEV